MVALKRNIWALYLLIVVLGAIILVALLYQRWHSITDGQAAYHKAKANLVYQSVSSFMRTQELVLDVVGRELLASGEMFDNQKVIPLLDSILAVNPGLVGFGLSNPDGKLVRISSNLDPEKLPNLRTAPQTAASFAAAQKSDHMVVGRTYYLEAMDGWVIPVRKALRAPEGKLLGVMTAGLALGTKGLIFNKQLHDTKEDSVILFRESDRYVQYMSRHNVGPEQYASIQVSKTDSAAYLDTLENSFNLSEQQIMANDEPTAFFSDRRGTSYLSAAIYDPDYKLWTISESTLKPMYRQFFAIAVFYVTGFLIIGTILFMFVRLIARAEQSRQQSLLYQARHDDLTGLLNRAGLLNRLENLLDTGKPFSLVAINIDNFSGINDRFGLKRGDEILIEFGRRLKRLTEAPDDLARLGSDEFLVLTPETDIPQLEATCTSLVHKLSQTFEVNRLNMQVGVRIGIACFPDNGTTLSELIRSAHLALYQSKQRRTTVCIYKPEMETAYLRALTIEQRLRFGLSSRALHMVYQPQVDKHGKMTGLEALVRWQDAELGYVSPAEFVGVAERSGLMIPLGQFVLRTSMAEFSQLSAGSDQPLDLSINISVIQFYQPGFVDTVLDSLEAYGVSADRLVLEITESLFIDSLQQVLRTVCELRGHGIRIAMDDFGTGYSSLSLLRQLPLDELKIDKSFVDAMMDDERASNMIRSIVAIARSHNMSLIAEGVEEESQVEALIAFGCSRFQGYYFGRPAPMDDLKKYLVETP